MSEDLQSLLEKINRDGVEKAQAEGARIVADAKTKAAAIVKDAEASAAKAKADAEKASADYAARAQETLRQAARDTVLAIESDVTALLVKLLVKDVDAALADPAALAPLVADAVRAFVREGDLTVAASTKLAVGLKAQLAAEKSVTVVTDETFGSGFAVKLDGGRVEHAFTGEVIAAELAKRLRPDLAALLK